MQTEIVILILPSIILKIFNIFSELWIGRAGRLGNKTQLNSNNRSSQLCRLVVSAKTRFNR